ncbi:hypothetical protein MMAD_43090 [Mycolicibacterium madagascariense]|uniref:DUF559 domain-containing protein n=1 Tax=Mycolicibacterium madagascariense TaxID=212765 RepID=A0A7I7XLB3_9MYCO|nr:hypothetical protein [Mycolicibacterium madagascariense]MCV7012339.1 hypothetical protein [Mycolicibacterium madagascariense]BBZ30014.1 hypothetical protein MMAD_43090 [Mycolicibacterium madagascariense]
MDHAPFVGSEALEAGVVTKYQLRHDFHCVFPGVYIDRRASPTLHQKARAAWLWSHRQGVTAGLTAAGLHGSKWIDDEQPVELIWPNARRPCGLKTFDFRLVADEFDELHGMRVTTPARTAFDLGRRGGQGRAVARLDALGNATRFSVDDVLAIADRHRGARGLRHLTGALDLYDPGAESPRETWLRLVLIRAGFPRPRTQISAIGPSGRQYYLDMGWEDIRVAVEYDGDQHRMSRPQFVKDVYRLEELREIEWIVVRVVAENSERDIVDRVRRARQSRLL